MWLSAATGGLGNGSLCVDVSRRLVSSATVCSTMTSLTPATPGTPLTPSMNGEADKILEEHRPPAGVVLPPRDIRAIVEKTADYVARNGQAFEGMRVCELVLFHSLADSESPAD